MPFINDPREIEKKSFEIIDGLLRDTGLREPEKSVVMRVVHATADPDFAGAMVFSPGAVQAGIEAIRGGCAFITDVRMLQAGISLKGDTDEGRKRCYIKDPDVALDATSGGVTRSTAAMRKAARGGGMDGAVVAIGNAPTALYEVMRLVREEGVRPALIVGVPVGFVGAAESKDELMGIAEVPFITSRGRKGGSPVGAAIINALVRLSAG